MRRSVTKFSRQAMTSLSAYALIAIAAGTLAGCGPKPSDYNAITRMPDPNRSLFIHLTGGNDPSNIIGRFIPDDVPDDKINASMAMQTRCTEFIKPRISDSSVERDEVFEENASFGMSASAPTAKASAGGSSGQMARVQYDIRKIMEADIADPEAFDQCCTQAPDQCTKRYIGRFVFGSGQIYQQAGAAADFGGGISEIKQLDLDAKWGFAWEKGTKFKDIYFGFELTNRASSSVDICSTDWARKVPSSLDGFYFVGTSAEGDQKIEAKASAESNANYSVVKYLFGEYLSGTVNIDTKIGEGADESSMTMKAAAQGAAKFVQIKCYSAPEVGPSGEVTLHALAYLPKQAAKTAIAGAVDSALQALPPNHPERKSLEDVKTKLNTTP